MKDYLPYIVTIFCTLISGFASYFVSRKRSKTDLQIIQKQFEVDIEKEREKFAMEKEKMKIEYEYQLALKDKERQDQLGADLISTVTKEYLRSPAGQAQMRAAKGKKH